MALDQHGTLLKMVVMVSQHHFTGRPCWSWLSWFICLSSRLWARHLARQGMPGSRNTLLRRVRRLPAPEAPPPRAIGLDDGAKRKGHTSGTIVVELDRHCP